MPAMDFIFQGFTPSTHVDAVRWVLACPQLMRAFISVAFVKKSGTDLIAAELKRVGARATAFVGIRNGVTSRQGLEALLECGVTTFVVDTGARRILFHPKIFFADGEREGRLVIGSANLTAGGLNHNVEGGLRVTVDYDSPEDRALSSSVRGQLESIAARHPQNIFQVAVHDLMEMQAGGRLLDESLAIAPHPATTASLPDRDVVPKIELAHPRLFPRMRRAEILPPLPIAVIEGVAAPVNVTWEPVWVSKPLTERDLTIPTGTNTHPTGSMNLDKGELPATVDHRHYFRDEVFNQLNWQRESLTVETAQADFQLVVKGISYGQARLFISHTVSTTTRSYQQKNAMTRLRWGGLRRFVATTTLLSRLLTLYRDSHNAAKFLIEID